MGLFVSIQTAYANPITRQQALENANEFLQKRGVNVKNAAIKHVAAFRGGETSGNAPYYVFNIGDDKGFVIASGDDCAHEVLGYSDEGHFDADHMPDGMKYMLDSYAEQIGYASKGPKTAKPKSSAPYPAVSPCSRRNGTNMNPTTTIVLSMHPPANGVSQDALPRPWPR